MKKTIILIAIMLLALTLSACRAPTGAETELPQAQLRTQKQQAEGAGTAAPKNTAAGQNAKSANSELSQAEAAGLLFMREEEKLAYDLYKAFYELWGTPVFGNIAACELTHMNSIMMLLQKYGLPDPAVNAIVGEFDNADLQALHDELFAQGQSSLENALRAAAAVEEIDILDLEEYIRLTERADIIQVYENLLAGSRNHLRAFVSLLENRSGQPYQPAFLTDADYQAIYQSEFESGGQGQPGGYGPGGQGNN